LGNGDVRGGGEGRRRGSKQLLVEAASASWPVHKNCKLATRELVYSWVIQ